MLDDKVGVENNLAAPADVVPDNAVFATRQVREVKELA